MFQKDIFREVPEIVHAAVTESFTMIEDKPNETGKRRKMTFPVLRIAVACVVCFLVSGLTVAAVEAISTYRQRMEEMNRELVEEFYSNASRNSVFHYSRELTDVEKARYETLTQEYEEQGRFPVGDLTYLEDYKDYKNHGIGLYVERSTLFLPEEELSDEELLQLIDFHHKVEYSVQVLGAEALAGNYSNYEENVANALECVSEEAISYKGSVDARCLASGRDCLYLAGTNVIERMEIGSDISEPFYAGDFGKDAVVFAMAEDMDGGLYVSVLVHKEDNERGSKLLHISKAGELLFEKDMGTTNILDLAVDMEGNLYGRDYENVYVFESDGTEICTFEQSPYRIMAADGMCRGKDGYVYLLAEEKETWGYVLLRVDLEAGELVYVADEFLPNTSPHCHTIARGGASDFILWRYDGLYTYNVGENAIKVMEAYEAPMVWEAAECVTLENGQVVFMQAFEYTKEGAGTPVPESIRFCYVTPE